MFLVYCLSVQFFMLNINAASLGAFMRNLRQKPSTSTLSLAEWPSYNIIEPNGPGTYAFGYEIEDDASKNIQFRDEEKLPNGTVLGSYGLVRPNGMITFTQYVADENGYRTQDHTLNHIESKPSFHTSTQASYIAPVSANDVDYLDITNDPNAVKEKPNTRLNKTRIPIMKVEENDVYQKQHITGNRYEYGNTNNRYHNYPYEYNNENDSNEQSHSLGHTNIRQEYPIKFKAGENLTFGLQLINNFIPHTYQIVPLYLDRKNYEEEETPAHLISHDEILPEEQQVNDKFFDPIFNEKSTDVNNKYNNFKISKTKLNKPKLDLVNRFQKEKMKLLRVHGRLF